MNKLTKPYNLTKKQKIYADHLLESSSPVEAALEAYDCKNTKVARDIAYLNNKSERIRSYLEAKLSINDTVGKAVTALDDALEAKVVFQGEQTGVPDHNTRLKASKQTLGLVMPKESSPKEVHLEKHQHTHFSFGDDVPQVVLEWIVENQGRWPSESQFKRLINGKSV